MDHIGSVDSVKKMFKYGDTEMDKNGKVLVSWKCKNNFTIIPHVIRIQSVKENELQIGNGYPSAGETIMVLTVVNRSMNIKYQIQSI